VVKQSFERTGLVFALVPLVNHLARREQKGVLRIFRDGDLWIHETTFGYFAYHEPYIRLDMQRFDQLARNNFFWGCRLRDGDTVVDIGAGAGEETLTFSRAVGPSGKVISVEAHPRTFRCLKALVEYNGLKNVTALHRAIVEPGRSITTIDDSSNYLANRVRESAGSAVRATTMDEVVRELGLRRINFLKMNIEGAERLAIQGMSQTLKQSEVLCIACHDFLADKVGDDFYRTRELVRQFLAGSGLRLAERLDPGLPVYVRYQVWGYNTALIAALAS
jgi:FkbM family methyltransferase